jgi:ADP-ribose pyrophosphatase YjhB (NUDIX family)
MGDEDRQRLIALLAAHRPADEKEAADLAAMRRFAGELAEPFSRQQRGAHFTGSAVVVDGSDPAAPRVCLVFHKKLTRWLQPGGHAEPGDGGNMAETALREAREETQLAVELHPGAPAPLDVDVHVIPARKDEPEHLHLDVRYLVRAAGAAALAHDPAESDDARFLTFDEALARADEPALVRLLLKARAALAG